MPTRLHVSALLGFVALVWAAGLLLAGVALPDGFLGPFNLVTGAVVLALAAFEHWLWRVPALQGWFVKRPNLNGTWRVQFQSDWLDPTTGQGIPPKRAYMTVRQTFSTLSMRLMTDESVSSLVAEGVILTPEGTFKVFAVYRNESKIAVRDRSPIHYGSFVLDVQVAPIEQLEGFYWTDRKTRGDMTLTDRRADDCGSYESAKLLFRD